jgi:hypothetical protein
MSNGQQLELVDGSLLEIKRSTLALDEGEIVGHRVLDLEHSRQLRQQQVRFKTLLVRLAARLKL